MAEPNSILLMWCGTCSTCGCKDWRPACLGKASNNVKYWSLLLVSSKGVTVTDLPECPVVRPRDVGQMLQLTP